MRIWDKISDFCLYNYFVEESHDPNKLRTVLKTLLDASADQREIIKELHSLMEEESSPAMLELMGKVTTTMEMNIAASDRSEDPKWFHGLYLIIPSDSLGG